MFRAYREAVSSAANALGEAGVSVGAKSCSLPCKQKTRPIREDMKRAYLVADCFVNLFYMEKVCEVILASLLILSIALIHKLY